MKMFVLIFGMLVSQISLASAYINKATVILKAGQEKRYFSAAADLDIESLTRQEPGNIEYNLIRDRHDPRKVTFHEVWKSKADLDAHLQFPHMQEFFKRINFNPAMYNISVGQNIVVFTPKSELTNYVIEMLSLEGTEKE